MFGTGCLCLILYKGTECHIQFKSDSYRVFMLYEVKKCLIHGVYIMYSTRVFSAECICHVQLKSD